MNVIARLAEVDDGLAAIKARYLAKSKGNAPPPFKTGSPAWSRECGLEMSHDQEMIDLSDERAALLSPIAGICSFGTGMFLATGAGLFEIVAGNRLRFIKLEAASSHPIPLKATA